MSYIHYKFVSKMEQKTITFNGLHISLTELKERIMAQENLKATTCELQISNEQTREKYTDDKVQIPKLSSVIVRRKPISVVKPGGKTLTLHCSEASVLESIKPDSQKRDKERKPAKTSKGILRSVIMKVEPDTKGAMPILTAEATSKLDEVTKGCHKDGQSDPRSPFSRRDGRSYERRSRPRSRSHSRSYAYRRSGFPQSSYSNQGHYRSGSPSGFPQSSFANLGPYRSRSPSGFPQSSFSNQGHYRSRSPSGFPQSSFANQRPYRSRSPSGFPQSSFANQGPYRSRSPSGFPQSSFSNQGHYRSSSPSGFPQSSFANQRPYRSRSPSGFPQSYFANQGPYRSRSPSGFPQSSFANQGPYRSRSPSGFPQSSFANQRPYRSRSPSGFPQSYFANQGPYRSRSPSGFPQSSFANQGPYRSRSRPRSHVGYRARSPGGRTPPPRELPPYERKGQSSGSQNRWDRERYQQREKNYADSTYFNDYDNQQPSKYHTGHSSRDKERDRMSSLPRNDSVHESARRRDNRTDRRAAPPPPRSSSSFTTKSSYEIPKTNKGKKRKADEPESSPVRDEPMDELPSQNKKSSSASKASGSTAASKAAPSKSSATAAKTSTKCVSKDQSDKAKTEKSSIEKTKTEVDGLKLKSDEMRRSEDAPNSTTPRKEKNNSSRARHSPVKAPPQAAHSLRPPHPPLDDGHHTRIRRDDPQGGGFHSLPPSNQHGLRLVHRPPSPAESRRRMREESWTSRGPPPGKMRRVDGPGMESGANSHSQAPRHPHFHRVPPSDRPGNRPLSGSRELNRSDPNRIPTEALMNTEVRLFS
uniref:Serine/arginine repetitive matrix protein 2-like n=1 Tax=Gouania willdenowi TaxID=441366 RepID=A0A8C5H583_GOUWI